MAGYVQGEAAQCPPGRLGAYASLGEPGYAALTATGNAQQMAVFIRRAVCFHGGDVTDEDALYRLAQEHCSRPRSYEDLLRELETYSWICWPGLRREASTHISTPTHADASSSGDVSFFGAPPGVEVIPGPAPENDASSSHDVPVPDPRQALREDPLPDAAQALRDDALQSPTKKKSKLHGDDDEGNAAASSAGAAISSAGAAASSSSSSAAAAAALGEVVMDDQQLCAEPFENFGAFVITAPPWRPQNIFSSRLFSLVLRNPRDPSRGLLLTSSTDRRVVSETARGILQELGPGVDAFAEPSLYEALQSDPALLAAVAEGGSGSHFNQAVEALGIPNALGGATASEAVQPEDEHGECPICFESIRPGEAAMRCNGDGGTHHYFHARCLQQWIRSCRQGRDATCPMCRGRLQFNGQRLQEFLDGQGSTGLTEEDRSLLQEISDGLRGRNNWTDMKGIEKAAYAGGILAAAGWGFMLGYTEQQHRSSTALVIHELPAEHQIAQGVGWLAGLLFRIIREVARDRERDRRRSSDRRE
eukprot:TRINITY_DN28991_c0_g1_i1.p1 TRINITY_DN28991_c0_g1~~TRINITY_DN28991_c0_g1_i1.p1  ORF type:complete len:547 (-),score=114.98 TRINITY_DN28991_c0_g1_i1:87-1688(-)